MWVYGAIFIPLLEHDVQSLACIPSLQLELYQERNCSTAETKNLDSGILLQKLVSSLDIRFCHFPDNF